MTREELLSRLEDAHLSLEEIFLEEYPNEDYGDIPGAMEYYRQLPNAELADELAKLSARLGE